MNGARRHAILVAAGMGLAAFLGARATPKLAGDAADPVDLKAMVPDAFGDWRVDPVAAAFVRPDERLNRISQRLYQQLLERTYISPQGQRVMVSIAYGREQTSSLELHWPENCYRFVGFTVHGRAPGHLNVDGRELPVTRLVAELPLRPEPITYWAVLGGEQVGDSGTYRMKRLAHSVRRLVPDGLLVRISSIDPRPERAFALHATFIEELRRAMAPEHRAKVFGAPHAT